MTRKAIITNIQRFSVHDGPGIRTTVFFKGCPLACLWCANPENIEYGRQISYSPSMCIECEKCINICETKAFTKVNPGLDTKANIIDFDPTKCIVCGKCAEVCSTESCKLIGKEYTADELIDELNRDMIFYEESGGGITFSGGEPLLDADFVRDVANEYKKRGISTALETCGQASWNSFNRVMAVIDWFLYDLKFVDEEKHRRYCGHTNEQILSNLIKLCESNEGKIIVRIPIIPGINDSEEELKAKGKFLKQRKHRIHEVHLLPYHNLGLVKYDNMGIKNKMESLVPPDSKYMKKITEILGNFDLTIRIGG